MSDEKPAEMLEIRGLQTSPGAATSRTNPWGVALLVFAGAFFLAAAITWAYGKASSEATFDNATGLTHDQLALYQHIAAMTLAGFGALLVILRITAEAVRWDLKRRETSDQASGN